MIQLTLSNLVDALQKKGIDAKIQEESNQVYFIFKDGQREFPLFMRIYDKGELFQMLAFVSNFKTETVNDVARLLHLFNKELDVPGFGMDETIRYTFYRSMIPIQNNTLDPFILDAYINTIQTACKMFAQAIDAVGQGVATFEEVIKKAKETT